MTRPPRSGLAQDSAPAPPLNENHVRRLQATFWYVDDLLRSIEALTHPDLSPFVRERPDLSQDEARMLLSFVGLARSRMLAALDRLGIPRPEQMLSARRSVATSLLFAEISLSELETRSLRGYGALDPVAAEEITALSADLQNLMRRGKALLEEQEEGGLVEQVASLAGLAGEVLRRLLAVSTARGLTEMRPLIAAAAERAAATTLDVGVFGRVSSGKSSLINALVGEPVLPVGATPVTAVPLRVSQGPHAVEVRFRDGKTEQIPLSALPEVATEEKNPQNARGVRSIEVTVPGAPPGLRLLDTPGVGSLASSGSAQAFAWLPRCDFGLVLVAAGTPLGRDETALVSGLRHAVSAASRGLSGVREAVDHVRSQAGEGEEAGARRLPPLFDPVFLDAIKTLPPPRLVPGLLRRSRAQGAVEPLLPFLDEALARYAARLEAWGSGALRELRPAGQTAAATDDHSPELAGLEGLIAQVGAFEQSQIRPNHERTSPNAQ
jgi:hypothetical protein